jgi:hypothetical protein
MIGQMCWLNSFGSEHKVLHLRLHPNRQWTPYTELAMSVPDYNIPGGSKGLATYHLLSKAGWELLSTRDAHKLTSIPQAHDDAA